MRVVEELHARERRRRIPSLKAGAERLTEREWQVLELLGKDLTTKEVARRMEISEVTVRRHLSAVMSKLGVDSRGAALELLNQRDR